MTNEEARNRIYRFIETFKICGSDNYNPTTNITKQDYEALKLAIKALEQTKWIPCSERMPEREGWYLTSLGDKTYGGADVDMYCKGWVKYGTHVLAWMPLPQPYKAENEKNVCKDCYYNDGEVHAECVICDKAESEDNE